LWSKSPYAARHRVKRLDEAVESECVPSKMTCKLQALRAECLGYGLYGGDFI